MTAAEYSSKNIRVVLTLLFLAITLSYASGLYVVLKKPYNKNYAFRKLLDNGSLNAVRESAIYSEDVLTVLHFLNKLYNEPDIRPKTKRRQGNRRPSVELGPGSIKSPILKYPEKYFEKKLKHLLKLQKQREERNKDLNGLRVFF